MAGCCSRGACAPRDSKPDFARNARTGAPRGAVDHSFAKHHRAGAPRPRRGRRYCFQIIEACTRRASKKSTFSKSSSGTGRIRTLAFQHGIRRRFADFRGVGRVAAECDERPRHGVSLPISGPVASCCVEKVGRSGRICCLFVLPLIFLDFFRLRFSFVYLRCVPNATSDTAVTEVTQPALLNWPVPLLSGSCTGRALA